MYIISLIFLTKITIVTGFNRRIIGGTGDYDNNYPYVVRMKSEKTSESKTSRRFHCTGSAFTPVWILAAAHCVQYLDDTLQMQKMENETKEKRKFKYKNVIRYDSKIPSKDDKFVGILYYIAHPNYRVVSKDGDKNNDIALLKTDPMLIKTYARISAVDYGSIIGHEVTAAGHGIMSSEGIGTLKLKKPLQLLKVIVKKCEKSDLKSLYPCICIAKKCGTTGSLCGGDSGGPLIHSSGIIGVTSKGNVNDCTVKDKHRSYLVGLITPVSPYLDWISLMTSNDDNNQTSSISISFNTIRPAMRHALMPLLGLAQTKRATTNTVLSNSINEFRTTSSLFSYTRRATPNEYIPVPKSALMKRTPMPGVSLNHKY